MAGTKRAATAVAGPVMRKPEAKPERVENRKAKAGWCKFTSRARCYVEGVLMEEADQEITLSPRGSYAMRNTKVLYLTEGEVPKFVLPQGITPGSEQAKQSELDFIEDLDDGDPIVGAAPGGLKLIKQG